MSQPSLNMVDDEANGNLLIGPLEVENSNLSPSKGNHSLSSTPPQRVSGSSPECFPTPDAKKRNIQDLESKKLNRGISRATDNVNLVSQARSVIIAETLDQEYFLETPIHTFSLPDLNAYPDDFRAFLVKDLIAVSTQQSLEQANRLNWWTAHCHRLWPLSTSGDGNCLLHAASLGMWGFHDRLLTLRKTLHGYLSDSPRRESLWRRWRRYQALLNAQAGLVYSEVEWRQEWNAIVNMASSEPRLRRLSVQSEPGSDCGAGNIYESLEEVHVLALAHVLRRPIIVIADTVLKDMNGDDLAPIPFGGIYLPLECLPSECHRSPLLLAYDGGHFSALVAMDAPSTGPNCGLALAVPLTDNNGDLLPIQFSVDPGNSNELDPEALTSSQNHDLLAAYLDVIKIDPNGSRAPTPDEGKNNGLLGSIGKSVGQKLRLKITRSNSQRQKVILCAVLHTDKRHEHHDAMINNYLETARQRFQLLNEKSQNNSEEFPGITGALRYNAGNSLFYTEADQQSHAKISQLSPVKPPSNEDPTLYLSNSTFYEPSLEVCHLPINQHISS